MRDKKKLPILITIVVALALGIGLTSIAAGNYGTQDDPLITRSYLDATATPNILDKLNGLMDEKATALTESFTSMLDGTEITVQSGFSVLTLTEGQTLQCSVGTEIMLRVGSAVSAGPDNPRLIDETGGVSITDEGTALEKNHMYMVTIINNGITATASTVKVVIRGEYTIV